METELRRPILARLGNVLAAFTLALAIAGSIADAGQDITQAHRVAAGQNPRSSVGSAAQDAPGKADVAATPKASQLPPSELNASVVTSNAVDMKERIAALQQRAELRAYFGAPPVIPHEIDQLDSPAACLTCHGHSAESDEENPKTPHSGLTSCTQCHVNQELDLLVELETAGNDFQGLAEPTGGQRAWAGAPPTIPHSTLLRNKCLSCHGSAGRIGVRSSHPERLNCRQCHVSSARLNQRAAGEAAAFQPDAQVFP